MALKERYLTISLFFILNFYRLSMKLKVGVNMFYLPQNKRQFEHCNINYWHDAGYAGQGVSVGTHEPQVRINQKRWNGTVHDPLGYGIVTDPSHAEPVLDMVHQIAPYSDKYLLNFSGSFSSNSMEGTVLRTLDWLDNNKIDIITSSVSGNHQPPFINRVKKLQNNGTTFVVAAGNDGERGLNRYSETGVPLAIGAVHMMANGRIIRGSYSSVGDKLDFMMFSGLHSQPDPCNNPNYTIPYDGTSFATPAFTGMMALFIQLFKEKTGRSPYQDEIVLFCLDNITDYGDEGHDKYFGHGLVRLPKNPKDVNVKKYILRPIDKEPTPNPIPTPQPQQTKIELWIGKNFALVNGNKLELDQPPVIQYSRTLVPVRFISTQLGCSVDWNGQTQEVTLTHKDKRIIMIINSKTININGHNVEIDVAPEIIRGRTMLPLRFLLENIFEAQVNWDGLEQKITIIK